jgi:hypothetical protein
VIWTHVSRTVPPPPVDPGGLHILGVFWPWIVGPLALLAAAAFAVGISAVIVRWPPRPRAARIRSPWTAGVPDRAAAAAVIAEAERTLHAHDPLVYRAVFTLRYAFADPESIASPGGPSSASAGQRGPGPWG